MVVETKERLIADLKGKNHSESLRYTLFIPFESTENIMLALWQGIEFYKHPVASTAILSRRELDIEEARKIINQYVTADDENPIMKINEKPIS